MAKKHFAFGDLRATSPSIPGGIVYWNFHVAPMVRLNDNRLYILDPALCANPIEKEEWYKLMMLTHEASITGFVTCEPNTYDEESSCFNPLKQTDESVHCEIQEYLKS